MFGRIWLCILSFNTCLWPASPPVLKQKGHYVDDFLTHWGWEKMAAFLQTTFSLAFSWMKMYKSRLTFPWKYVPKGPINNIPALVQIMAWHRTGDKPLSEPMMFSLLTHICITQPHWVNHSLHRRLSSWQPLVQPVIKKQSTWQLFHFSFGALTPFNQQFTNTSYVQTLQNLSVLGHWLIKDE